MELVPVVVSYMIAILILLFVWFVIGYIGARLINAVEHAILPTGSFEWHKAVETSGGQRLFALGVIGGVITLALALLMVLVVFWERKIYPHLPLLWLGKWLSPKDSSSR